MSDPKQKTPRDEKAPKPDALPDAALDSVAGGIRASYVDPNTGKTVYGGADGAGGSQSGTA